MLSRISPRALDSARSNRRRFASARRIGSLRNSNREKLCARRKPRRCRATWVGTAHGYCIIRADDSNALRAPQPDAVVGQQIFVFINVPRQRVDYAAYLIEEPGGGSSASRPRENNSSSFAGQRRTRKSSLFLRARGSVEEHRHRAEVNRMRPYPNQCEAMRVSSVSSTRMYCARLELPSQAAFPLRGSSPSYLKAARGSRSGR